jgi:predicted CxxxxCH...CXXCH cytochrome family protein
LAQVTGICDTCHSGAGSGTEKHYDGTTEVQFLNAYNAKSGNAVRNADGTCSNVSCHGGQTTPVWLTGTIDVTTQCKSCHAFGTTEYNSYVSGQHYTHVLLQNINCAACHDPGKLAQKHFTTLNTATMEGPASDTIADYVNYDPATLTCSSMGCHETRVW